jgi:hypothetical protein
MPARFSLEVAAAMVAMPLLLAPAAPVHKTGAYPLYLQGEVGCQTFPQTGKQVCGRFLEYWRAHGGLMQQGYPISNQFQEASEVDGKTYIVQYFERAVFELHPQNQPPFDVLLSLLGTMRYREKYPAGVRELPPDTMPGPSMFFPQTGKTVRGVFLEYWRAHGGLMQQGYPITNLIWEKSELDGKEYVVQYFERAVFEHHPENAGTQYEVLLSQLGTLRFKQKYPQGEPKQPARALPTGIWGGQSISMNVTSGGAIIEYDCAHGTIDHAIVLDAAGRFEATGTHVFEKGGPVREGEPEDKHPARYSGVVTGNTMVLTVTITDQNRVIGTFKLTYGTPGRVVRCL